MIKAIAIIPARGGSRRVPRKNIRDFCGRPMIEYAIETAKVSGLFDQVYVSTDDDEVEQIARCAGAAIARRPWCDGTAGTQTVAAEFLLREVASKYSGNPAFACVIYPTTPLLLPSDLQTGFQALLSNPGAQFAMAVGGEPLADAGAYYWGWTSAFRAQIPLVAPHTVMVPLPPERVCDINTHVDWDRAVTLYQRMMGVTLED